MTFGDSLDPWPDYVSGASHGKKQGHRMYSIPAFLPWEHFYIPVMYFLVLYDLALARI